MVSILKINRNIFFFPHDKNSRYLSVQRERIRDDDARLILHRFGAKTWRRIFHVMLTHVTYERIGFFSGGKVSKFNELRVYVIPALPLENRPNTLRRNKRIKIWAIRSCKKIRIIFLRVDVDFCKKFWYRRGVRGKLLNGR